MVLSFHPRFSHFEPVALAMLAAWADFWTRAGVQIVVKNSTVKGVAYAQRLGLFKFLPSAGAGTFAEHEEAGRFVELHRIHRQPELSKLIADLGGILRVPELIETVQYVVAEMTRNVIEHAQADAFLCVQHYKAAKRVSIGVADTGRGVFASLQPYHPFKTNAEALLGALRPGISGTSATPYGTNDNAGLGLFFARGLAKWTSQYFMLLSGDTTYRLKHKQSELTPARDPRKDAHDLFDGHKRWCGTAVSIDISANHNHKKAMLAIGAAANPDDELREVTSRIKFT
jgi:hypothetical protein